jgi:hypothetical protein
MALNSALQKNRSTLLLGAVYVGGSNSNSLAIILSYRCGEQERTATDGWLPSRRAVMQEAILAAMPSAGSCRKGKKDTEKHYTEHGQLRLSVAAQ